MKQIASRDNPHFKQLRKWAEQGRARREAEVLLLDGLHLLGAAMDARFEIIEIVVSASGSMRPENAEWLAAHANPPVVQLPDALFGEIAATESPSGILGIARTKSAEAMPDATLDSLVLDGVQDPGNVGTLLRTAAAAGLRQAVLGPGCADAWAPKTLRAGQGAQFQLAVFEQHDLGGFLEDFQGQVVVTRLDAEASLYDADLDGTLAWVFGSEGRGVSSALQAKATISVKIPMPGRTESLNVAAAAAVCLFEVVRRHR